MAGQTRLAHQMLGPFRLIACTGGNRLFTDIALAHGYSYGCRVVGDAVRAPLYFADQDWKSPSRAHYMRLLDQHRPVMAAVLDLEREDQFDEVMCWAEEASRYALYVLVIPKVNGIIAKIPRWVGQARIVLAYSVPSKYGATTVPYEEFSGRPVHLLGGSPFRQVECYRELTKVARVVSADGDYAQKQATRFCQFFVRERVSHARNKNWPTLKEYDGKVWEGNGPGEAWRRSCVAIRKLWEDEGAL